MRKYCFQYRHSKYKRENKEEKQLQETQNSNISTVTTVHNIYYNLKSQNLVHKNVWPFLMSNGINNLKTKCLFAASKSESTFLLFMEDHKFHEENLQTIFFFI